MFLYVVNGAVTVAGTDAAPRHLIELDRAGDTVPVTARSAATLLYGHGDVIGEPMVAHGPFVMNSRAEIDQAIRDYQAGLFGKPPPVPD